MNTSSAGSDPIPHVVKKGARYLPAFKRPQFGAHVGKWAVKIIRGRSFASRDEALRCADAAIALAKKPYGRCPKCGHQ